MPNFDRDIPPRPRPRLQAPSRDVSSRIRALFSLDLEPYSHPLEKEVASHKLDLYRDDMEATLRAFRAREVAVAKYAWSCLSPKGFRKIVDFSADRPVVSIGAGSGYNEFILSSLGVDMHAYDINPPNRRNVSNVYHRNQETWMPVSRGSSEKVLEHPGSVLMLSWPPYDDEFAFDTLKQFLEAGGSKMVYMGEAFGGCTASDSFFDLLDVSFGSVERIYNPNWAGIHDELWLCG